MVASLLFFVALAVLAWIPGGDPAGELRLAAGTIGALVVVAVPTYLIFLAAAPYRIAQDRAVALVKELGIAQAENGRLTGLLREYEGGPRFHVALRDGARIISGNIEALGGEKHSIVAFVLITNEGRPGAAQRLRTFVRMPDGAVISIRNAPLLRYNFYGLTGGSIDRADLIAERIATSIDTLETRRGYYIGFVDDSDLRHLYSNCEFVVVCEDHKGRVFGQSFPMEWSVSTEHEAILEEPTLPSLFFDVSKASQPPKPSEPGIATDRRERGES